MKSGLFMCASFVGLASCIPFWSGGVSQQPWPTVAPLTQAVHFVDREKQEAKMEVVGIDGKPLYLLECHLNAYDYDDPNFDYSGDFECRMISLYSNNIYSTLLTEDANQSRDWQSRGRFLLSELVGKCGDYPEYGKIRHFRLRGMNLTLEISKLIVEPGSKAYNRPWPTDRIKELDLKITIVSDPKSSSAIAEKTIYLEPPRRNPNDPNDRSRDCERVLTRK